MSKQANTPTHVGIILDGNRRWAKQHNLKPTEGHRRGLEVLKEISFHAFNNGVEYLTAYVFSAENWRRTEEEVNYLMDLSIRAMEKYLSEFNKRGIRVIFLGRRNGLRANVLTALQNTEQKTSHNTNGTLALCFNYGGQDEILDAVKSVVNSKISSDQITLQTLQQHLYQPGLPEVDLLIRTSGEQRTSGFMLFRSAYSELKFHDKYWPEYTISDFDQDMADYSTRHRRFGK